VLLRAVSSSVKTGRSASCDNSASAPSLAYNSMRQYMMTRTLHRCQEPFPSLPPLSVSVSAKSHAFFACRGRLRHHPTTFPTLTATAIPSASAPLQRALLPSIRRQPSCAAPGDTWHALWQQHDPSEAAPMRQQQPFNALRASVFSLQQPSDSTTAMHQR